MATPFNPDNAQDWDEPLNQDPIYSGTHVFSTGDITVRRDGVTVASLGALVFDTTDPKTDYEGFEGISFYPIDSVFGVEVIGGEIVEKTLDGDYAEGWAADLQDEGEQIGLAIADSPTFEFDVTPGGESGVLSGLPNVFGTRFADGNVKASSEKFSVMEYMVTKNLPIGTELDTELTIISGSDDYDGETLTQLIDEFGDVNGDGVADIKDFLLPNETSVTTEIAYSDHYSVVLKDDGKLLYRWGDQVNFPNDVRVEGNIELPDVWKGVNVYTSVRPLYEVTAAEFVLHHTITNNPNDQIRPEDIENEDATGRLPSFVVVNDYNGEIGRTAWVTTEANYSQDFEGDEIFFDAGTVLWDSAIADAAAAAEVTDPGYYGQLSPDAISGFTYAYAMITDREPFEAVVEDGEYESGPRWRVKPEKFGQDLPGVIVPEDPTVPTADWVEKYTVGAETQTVLNLLDGDGITPLAISAGWQNNAGEATVNGLNMSDDFDFAVYIKGEQKPTSIYSAELAMDYERVQLHAEGEAVTGDGEANILVGMGDNTFEGGAGADLFIVSYATSATDVISSNNVISDFEAGVDKIALIGFDALAGFDPENPAGLTQAVVGDDLVISVDGTPVVTLTGVTEELNVLENFLVSNPTDRGDELGEAIDGNATSEELYGTFGDDTIAGNGGNDYIFGLSGNDVLDGGEGLDNLYGGLGQDTFVFAAGTQLDIVHDFTDDDVIDVTLAGATSIDDLTITDFQNGAGAMIETGGDRMLLLDVDSLALTADDFVFADAIG